MYGQDQLFFSGANHVQGVLRAESQSSERLERAPSRGGGQQPNAYPIPFSQEPERQPQQREYQRDGERLA
jgi:hypothetical protein